MSKSYQLNFVIPAGPTGPTGNANLSVYGGRYNNTSSTINLVLGSQSQVPLTQTMASQNTSYTTANSITVSQGGVYEINYFMNLSSAVATTLTSAIRINGTNIPQTVISRALQVGTGAIYSGSVLVSLAAGNVIDMAISALVAVGVTLGTGVNATLTVKKIG